MTCILKFEYYKNYIDSELIPWKNNDKKSIRSSTDIIEEYQVGTIIKHQKLIKIITPFSVYIPYAKCSILNTNTTLALVSYCFFTRIAIYTTSAKNIKKYINSNQLNTHLDKIENSKITLQLVDRSIIELQDQHISFENILNDNIYTFVWLKASTDKASVDEIIPGMHICLNDILIGIIYNIIGDQLYIIPNITILLNLDTDRLTNIFITINKNNQITKTYTPMLKINDKIILINDQPLDTNSMIYFEEIKLNIPLNTYLWYYPYMVKLNISRESRLLTLYIKPEQLDKKIFNSFSKNI